MVIPPTRFEQLIARRKYIKPNRYARWLNHFDGNNRNLRTTELSPEVPFVRDTHPIVTPLPVDDIPNTLSTNNDHINPTLVSFSTVTETSINPSPNHPTPYQSSAPPATPTSTNTTYFQQRHSTSSSTTDSPSTYYTTDEEVESTSSEEEEDTTISTRSEQRRAALQNIRLQIIENYPRTNATFNDIENIPTLTYQSAQLTYCNSNLQSFPLETGIEYFFNDVSIIINNGNLEIIAVCPEVIDTTLQNDDIDNGSIPTPNQDSVKTPPAADDPTYSQPETDPESEELDFDESLSEELDLSEDSSEESDEHEDNEFYEAAGTQEDAIDLTQSDCDTSIDLYQSYTKFM
jgi:hypothetical protein